MVTDECICWLNGVEDPPRWVKNPDPLGCPIHGPPSKQFCRIHHNGFYGACQSCQYADQLEKQEEIRSILQTILTQQKSIRKSLADAST